MQPFKPIETPEEIELRRRQKTLKRIRMLSALCIASISARFLIKDPPPPPPIDRTNYEIRYTPGLLDQMPKSTLDRLDPKLLAKLRAADMKAKQEAAIKMYGTAYTHGNYKPADVPLTNAIAEEETKQLKFIYEKRRAFKLREKETVEKNDPLKPMLILFRNGGFMRAQRAAPLRLSYDILVDRSMRATLPQKMVASVSDNAREWQEPVPQGHVRLKPATGITITVAKETAKRITVRNMIDEI